MPASTRDIRTLADVAAIRRDVLGAAVRTQAALASLAVQLSPLDFLAALKLETVGFHPFSAARLNLIEQLNQSLTGLTSLAAVAHLLSAHPLGAPYRLNLGTAAGTDIASAHGLVAAEVFSAVRPQNNRKLASDVRRVSHAAAEHRYVFFYSPAVPSGIQPSLSHYPHVRIVALSKEAVLTSCAGA